MKRWTPICIIAVALLACWAVPTVCWAQSDAEIKKIEDMVMLIRGALQAFGKVGLKMNVKKADLDGLVKELPAMKNPTVAPLYDDQWVAIETIIDERQVREIIPRLRDAGACDIIEYPLNKVID